VCRWYRRIRRRPGAVGENLWDLAGRLPQELRRAKISDREKANQFLRERYIGEFNAQFTIAYEEKGTAFRRCSRKDLEWIFTVQTERVVAKDNTVAIGERQWQIDKRRFRSTLAGCTVTIHEHLNGEVSVRYNSPKARSRCDPGLRWTVGMQPEAANANQERVKRAVEMTHSSGDYAVEEWKSTSSFPTFRTAVSPVENRTNSQGGFAPRPARRRFAPAKAEHFML
jgi:hypothetical protein